LLADDGNPEATAFYFLLVDDSGVIQSESWPEYVEYACNVRVNFSLLTDSYDEGASPWDVVPIVLQFIDAIERLPMYLAVGRSKHQRQTIVGCIMMREESHPRLGLALILREAQW
jgi:hypothetical protein